MIHSKSSMKTIVIHGDDLAKSYTRLNQLIDVAKNRQWEIGETLDFSASLFAKERLFIVRDYRLLTKKIISLSEKLKGNIVIYHQGIIPQGFLKSLPEPKKIEEYKLPKVIWNFLDRPSAKLLHEVVKNEPIEFVFALLARRFRDLYWAKIDPKSLNCPAWQVGKLKKQSQNLTAPQLQEIIGHLAEIDILAKTSKADLLSSLDLLFLTKLE